MRRDVIALAPDDSIAAASEMMRLGRIRQLPVVEGGRLLGELSWRDACGAYRPAFDGAGSPSAARRGAIERAARTRVAELMRPAAERVGPDAALREVAAGIVRSGAGFVPVVVDDAEGARILGVVTESDLLRAVVAAKPQEQRASAGLSLPPIPPDPTRRRRRRAADPSR